jgi:hypothetical protein
MLFNSHDLKEFVDSCEAKKITTIINKHLVPIQKMTTINVKYNGKKTAQMLSMNHYHIEDAMDVFSLPTNRESIKRKRLSRLAILEKVKNNLKKSKKKV